MAVYMVGTVSVRSRNYKQVHLTFRAYAAYKTLIWPMLVWPAWRQRQLPAPPYPGFAQRTPPNRAPPDDRTPSGLAVRCRLPTITQNLGPSHDPCVNSTCPLRATRLRRVGLAHRQSCP
jgi:hypothetical protein